MFQFKKRFTGLFLALTVFAPLAFSQSNIIDEVIAVVGDNPVLRSDVEFQYEQAMMQGSNFQGVL